MFARVQEIALYSVLLQFFLQSNTASGQDMRYSNKAFGITIDFPKGWVLLTEQEINTLRNAERDDEINLDMEAMEDINRTTIICVALNKRLDPDYTIQIISDRIIEASKDKSEYDYLVNGIQYMWQQGLPVSQYTLPVQYLTAKGISLYTSKLVFTLNGQPRYEKNFVIKRLNDFIVISGSFPDVHDDAWMHEVVESLVLN